MRQNFTSAATSINKTKLPAIYGKLAFHPGDVVLDYGCGRYTEHIAAALPEGVEYLPYDPFNQPMDVNQRTAKRCTELMREHEAVTVLCSNVLNVIDGVHEIRAIVRNISTLVRKTGGTAYITVYEGDRTGKGKQTGKDSWQRNEKLADYLQFFPMFPEATIRKGMIIVR